jgi:hypothetical protein
LSSEFWGSWQTFSALAGQGGPSAFATLTESAARCLEAARAYVDAVARATSAATVAATVAATQGTGTARAPGGESGMAAAAAASAAARALCNVLREQALGTSSLPWHTALSAAAAPWAMMRDVPALGLTREHQQRWQQTADAARGVADAQRRLQDYWSDVLHEAAASFAARLAVPVAGVTPRSLYEAWIDCAEAAYARTAQDDLFCEALADYVNATSRWRTHFAAIVEHWSTLLDLPTRSELNSLLRRLQSLERRLTSEPAAAGAAGPPCAAPPGTPP